MNRTLTLAALAAAGLMAVLTPGANADFAVTNAGPADQARTATGVVSDVPHVGPGDPGGPLVALVRPRSRPMRPARPLLVLGFGDAVPLAFACRQIVPDGIAIKYGPGADPGMIVTWTGGDTWAHVLAAAVKPLGLHLIQSGNMLTIES